TQLHLYRLNQRRPRHRLFLVAETLPPAPRKAALAAQPTQERRLLLPSRPKKADFCCPADPRKAALAAQPTQESRLLLPRAAKPSLLGPNGRGRARRGTRSAAWGLRPRLLPAAMAMGRPGGGAPASGAATSSS